MAEATTSSTTRKRTSKLPPGPCGERVAELRRREGRGTDPGHPRHLDDAPARRPRDRHDHRLVDAVEPGKLDPSVNVLVIDYESVPENPNLLIRQIRDELVQIVPGTNLGKMLVKLPRRKEPFAALYFALKSEI